MRGITLTLALLAAAGCRHAARRADCPTGDCGPAVGLGEPFAPRGGTRIAPTEVPIVPGSPAPLRPAAPPREIPEERGYAPQASVPTVPTLPPREVLRPSDGSLNRVQAPPSVAARPPELGVQFAGLPGYAPVPGRTGVATGRKPTTDGFDTLKSLGYRTVLYVHAPGTDVTAARELAAARGLAFVPLAVAPETLRLALPEFAKAVTDPQGRPVYVADESGVRAGSLWYLFFRTAEYASDDVARVRATPLGLPADAATDEAKAFWLAVQQILSRPAGSAAAG